MNKLTVGNTIKFDKVVGHSINYSYGKYTESFPDICRGRAFRKGIYQTMIFNQVPPGFRMSLEEFKGYKFIQIE